MKQTTSYAKYLQEQVDYTNELISRNIKYQLDCIKFTKERLEYAEETEKDMFFRITILDQHHNLLSQSFRSFEILKLSLSHFKSQQQKLLEMELN